MRVLTVALGVTRSVFVVREGPWGSLLIRVVLILFNSLLVWWLGRGTVSDKMGAAESLSFLGVARSLAHS